MQNPIYYPTMASVKNAAARFNVAPEYVRKLCRTGKICYTAISSRKWLVNMDTLARFFAQESRSMESAVWLPIKGRSTMAQIIPKAKKDGSMSYLARVYAGRTQDDKVITRCKTVTPPAGMGKKKAEKWVQEQAVLFEQQVTNGLVRDSDMLLDDLIDRWFEEYANKQLKAKTLYDYRRMRGRISAGLGHLKASRSSRRM